MENSTGKLTIVPSPIGNREDITLRAIVRLFNCDTVLCEDTRVTGNLIRLLKPYYISLRQSGLIEGRDIQIETKLHLKPFFEHNEDKMIDSVLNALRNRLNLCLISDSGTPLVSDPGYKLIRECIAQGLPLEVLPGASAVITALVGSGLPPDKFTFIGYPPRKQGNRIKLFENLKKQEESLKSTVVFFEAPHKLEKTLVDLKNVFGDIEIVLMRELTKVFEERKKLKISEVIENSKTKKPKGEYVILFSF